MCNVCKYKMQFISPMIIFKPYMGGGGGGRSGGGGSGKKKKKKNNVTTIKKLWLRSKHCGM